ncbi:MAG: hypothetical protein MUD08_16890 [Cytophagales bacterium]|nr:hypothetical protein [Cytophagales bacterium]
MELILKVEDSQASFLLELLGKFDFVQVEMPDRFSMEDEAVLDERIKRCEDPENLISWEDFKKDVSQTFGF